MGGGDCLGYVPETMQLGPKREEFENASLPLRLNLPPTVIRHENRAFQKRSSYRKNLKQPAGFSFSCEHFENGAFRKRFRLYYYVIYLTEFSSTDTIKSKMTSYCCIFNSSGLVWTENI